MIRVAPPAGPDKAREGIRDAKIIGSIEPPALRPDQAVAVTAMEYRVPARADFEPGGGGELRWQSRGLVGGAAAGGAELQRVDTGRIESLGLGCRGDTAVTFSPLRDGLHCGTSSKRTCLPCSLTLTACKADISRANSTQTFDVPTTR